MRDRVAVSPTSLTPYAISQEVHLGQQQYSSSSSGTNLQGLFVAAAQGMCKRLGSALMHMTLLRLAAGCVIDQEA